MGTTSIYARTHTSRCSMASARSTPMKRANEFGMGAVALTDHGALYGAINFYEAAHKGPGEADRRLRDVRGPARHEE